MKYKVTDKHPVYKKGLIITNEREGYDRFELRAKRFDDNVFWEIINKDQIDVSVSNKWIKEIIEIQEPKFTKDDMIAFGFDYYDRRASGEKTKMFDYFAEWQKENK